MKLFENVKNGWKSMSKSQKVKVILHAVCDIGATFLMDALGKKLYDEDDGRLKRLCMKTTLYGVGMAASTAAGKELDDIIDVILPEKKEENDDEEEDDNV